MESNGGPHRQSLYSPFNEKEFRLKLEKQYGSKLHLAINKGLYDTEIDKKMNPSGGSGLKLSNVEKSKSRRDKQEQIGEEPRDVLSEDSNSSEYVEENKSQLSA